MEEAGEEDEFSFNYIEHPELHQNTTLLNIKNIDENEVEKKSLAISTKSPHNSRKS
jgi:hypothetical protein